MGRFFIRFVIILLALSVTVLVTSWHFSSVFANPATLDMGLQRGGSYDRAAGQLRQTLKADIASGSEPTIAAALTTAVQTAVTPTVVRQMSQPPLVKLTTWLRTDAGGVPNLQLSTDRLRTAITTAAQQQLPSFDQSELQFELTRIIPATVTLTGNESAGGLDQTITTALRSLKQSYAQLQRLMMIAALCGLLLLVSLLLVSLGQRRTLLRRPAAALLLAGALCGLASYPLASALRVSLLRGGGNAVAAGGKSVLNYALESLWPWAVGLAAVAVVLFIISFIVPKPPETLPKI